MKTKNISKQVMKDSCTKTTMNVTFPGIPYTFMLKSTNLRTAQRTGDESGVLGTTPDG